MPDQHGAAAERPHEEGEIGGVVGEMVVAAAAHPFGVPVSAPVEGEDVMARGREPRGDEVPRVRVLEEAVQQENDGAVLTPFEQVVPEPVGDEEA